MWFFFFSFFWLTGIHNTISLFSAAVTDCKILFQSNSYSRQTDVCHVFKLKYSSNIDKFRSTRLKVKWQIYLGSEQDRVKVFTIFKDVFHTQKFVMWILFKDKNPFSGHIFVCISLISDLKMCEKNLCIYTLQFGRLLRTFQICLPRLQLSSHNFESAPLRSVSKTELQWWYQHCFLTFSGTLYRRVSAM